MVLRALIKLLILNHRLFRTSCQNLSFQPSSHSRLQPTRIKLNWLLPVADPGFSRGGRANSQIGIILSIFCWKLLENERIRTPRRGRASLTPPLRSANDYYHYTTDRVANAPLMIDLLSIRCIRFSRVVDSLAFWIQSWYIGGSRIS